MRSGLLLLIPTVTLGLAAIPLGCSRAIPPPKLPESDIALLAPAGEGTPAATLLRQMVPLARSIRPAHLVEDLATCHRENRVVVVPDASQLSGELLVSLLAHNEEGGPVLFIGTNPLPSVGEQEAGQWVFAPADHRYSFFGGEAKALLSGRQMKMRTMRVQSPLPTGQGNSGFQVQAPRWVPLFQVDGDDDWALGWPASCYVARTSTGVARSWGWIGADLTEENSEALQTMLAEAVAYLHGGRFLLHAGLDRFWIRDGEAMEIAVRCVCSAPIRESVRISAELTDESGYVLRRVSTEALTSREWSGTDPVRLNLGLAPGRVSDTVRYKLRITLEGADAQGAPVDTIEQTIKVAPGETPDVGGSRLTTTGPRFSVDKRAVFLLGLRYEPSGWFAPDAESDWLDPGQFDPYRVERDLARLTEGGINALAIDYHHTRQAPQLRYLLHEATARGLWLYLSVAGLDPLAPDFALASELIDAANLCRHPQVFAFELSRRDRLGNETERRAYDEAWGRWLEEQFDTIEHAEDVLGQTLWRDQGRVTGPPDSALSEDGPHRALVAAYRRFLDDLLSARYGMVRQFLDRHGCQQMVSTLNGGGSVPMTSAGHAPIDAASGVTHLDFVTFSARDLEGPDELFRESAFLTAYARGVSGGKPVIWLDLPPDTDARAGRDDLREQARVHGLMTEMIEASNAAGCFGLAGVLGPDGVWRKVGDVFRRFANRQRGRRNVHQVWNGRELDRDADARGLHGLWENWRTVYRDEMLTGSIEEVRPTGFGVPTMDIEPRAVGGLPYRAPAPLQSVNGEWGKILENDVPMVRRHDHVLRVAVRSTLNVELRNTGPATWSASVPGRTGTVWVQASRGDRKPQYLRVPTTDFGNACMINWTASEVGMWTLRPYLWARGAFGEPLSVEVRPQRHRVQPR